jgi:hypothetical protein
LFIFLDCCYAGEWCDKLKKFWKKEFAFNVVIFAGSQGPTDDSDGFFETGLFAENLSDPQKLHKKLTQEKAKFYWPMKWAEPNTLTILHVEVLRRVIFGSENLYDAIEELENSIEFKLLNAQKD